MIRMLVMDVDGTLTDGSLYISKDGECMKAFNTQDGYGIRNILPEKHIISAVITGRESDINVRRFEELQIDEVFQNQKDKTQALKVLVDKYGISYEEVAYIGDDINDLECMKLCGLSACPADSVDKVKEYAGYICKRGGGAGAVREFIDYLEDTYE